MALEVWKLERVGRKGTSGLALAFLKSDSAVSPSSTILKASSNNKHQHLHIMSSIIGSPQSVKSDFSLF